MRVFITLIIVHVIVILTYNFIFLKNNSDFNVIKIIIFVQCDRNKVRKSLLTFYFTYLYYFFELINLEHNNLS